MGGEKINFLSRDTDDTAMAGMSVATCQFVVSRSLGGRSRSIPYTCNRLRRLRRRFEPFWSISLSKSARWTMNSLALASRALREHYAAASMAYAAQATTHYQTYPESPPGADLPPKEVCNLDPMAPRSRQKRQLPEGPQ